jgi:carbonic anhydrase
MCQSCQSRGLDRRSFLATIAGASVSTLALPALASGKAKAIVLSCMDFRLVDDLVNELDEVQHMKNEYDHVVLAGASLGAVHEKFEKWHEVFWDHVGLAVKLHSVEEIIVVDHRDCGAYKLALGAETVDTPEKETEAHKTILATFAAEAMKRHPELGVKGYLMALDGSVEKLV